MFTTTLLTNPEHPNLDLATLDAVRNAWGGGDVTWLAPDIAAEFDISEIPENRWEVWASLQERQVDMVVQPSEGRRKKALLADMDSTMIGQECIDELASEAGIGSHVAEITERAMNGELGFEEALRERVALLAGLDAGIIERVLNTRISLTPGARTLVATMKAHGGYAALVSGGFTNFTSKVAELASFDEHRANTLLIEEGKLSGKVAEPILGREAKVAALHEVGERLGLPHEDILAVGDGANDLAMLASAGTGVAFRAKPVVAAQCDVRINFGDLSALLYIQGYNVEEFVD